MRERERVNSSPGFPLPASRQARRHKILFGIIVAVGIIIYAAFNVWVYQASKNGKVLKGDSLPKQGVTFTDFGLPTPTPSLRPTGPGQYACDEYGICNNYEDAKRVGCPKTYADPHCLNECGDKNIRCLKPK